MTEDDRRQADQPPGDQDEEVDLVPPSANRVAHRALTLAAVVCRSAIEGDAGNAEAESFRESVVKWVEEIGIVPEIEQDEMAMMRTPLGMLSERRQIDGTWRGEGLAVLGWALGRVELPPYDVQVDAHAVAQKLGFLEPREGTVLSAPQLRPAAELTSLADALFSLHWRLKEYSLVGAQIDFADVARRAWFGPLPIERLRLLEGDLELRGVPIFRAPEPVWREVMSIASERQQAANWLIGKQAIYSEVGCNT